MFEGGAAMPSNMPDRNRTPGDEATEDDRERMPSSNERKRQLDRERTRSQHDRGADETARGRRSQDTDPDSPDSDINRDDMIDEP
jgi:hypothetical protein